MPLLNAHFEEAGAEPGAAAHWTLLTFVAAERIAAFGPAPARAWEDFERWSELQLVLEPSDLAIGFFDPRPEGLEDFEEAWGNDHYLREWPTGQADACPFDDGSVEDLERGWGNDRFLNDWTELAALVGLFDGEPREEFEGAWLANETFVTAWTNVAAAVAVFSSGNAGGHDERESFAAGWPAATTI